MNYNIKNYNIGDETIDKSGARGVVVGVNGDKLVVDYGENITCKYLRNSRKQDEIVVTKKLKPFKIGDKVRVKDTRHIRTWTAGGKAIGYECTLTEDDLYVLHLSNNKFGINFKPSDLELVNELFKINIPC